MGLTRFGWACVLGITLVIGMLAATRAFSPVRAGETQPAVESIPDKPDGCALMDSCPAPVGVSDSRTVEIESRLRDQPDVAGAAVRLVNPSVPRECRLLHIYIRWHTPTPPPEIRLKTVAQWAASKFLPAPNLGVIVRDSAGRLYRMQSF